jgi:dTDP-4-dehydrorhamnose reductase
MTVEQTGRQKILLVGATGQLGRLLLRSLAPLGHLTATVHHPRPNDPALAHCLTLDLSNQADLRSVVRAVQPSLIVIAAAYTAVDKAEQETDLAQAVNATAPGILAEEGNRFGAAVVHYSTDYVFNGTGSRPWTEDQPTAPPNAYGRSKLAGEERIRASGVPHLIMRTSWLYGLHGPNFVKTMLRLGTTRNELKVVADQVGAPTPVSLLADVTGQILAQALGNPAGWLQERGGTLNVCTAGETSWHAFAEEIFRLARIQGTTLAVERVLPIASSEYPTPATRPLNSRLDLSRLRERFGLVPPDWRTALAENFSLLKLVWDEEQAAAQANPK